MEMFRGLVMLSPKLTLRVVLVCVGMLVFPAWAGPSKSSSEDEKPTMLEVVFGLVDWATSCDKDDTECQRRKAGCQEAESLASYFWRRS